MFEKSSAGLLFPFTSEVYLLNRIQLLGTQIIPKNQHSRWFDDIPDRCGFGNFPINDNNRTAFSFLDSCD